MLLEQEQNSLNNRWLIGKHVQTDAVLYLDDDDKALNPMYAREIFMEATC